MRDGRWLYPILAIEAFIAFGALAPGWSMLRDPSGAKLGLKPEWLIGSPFADYLVPGAFLFGAIGLGSLGLALLGLAKRDAAAPGACALGLFLMAWIGLQRLWLQPHSLLQPLVFTLGAVLLALGLWGWRKAQA